ncbi:MAG: hypothetical protein WCX73_00925 [Candidatus Pacearchaeota archaeon]|jgi:hypothetical protein
MDKNKVKLFSDILIAIVFIFVNVSGFNRGFRMYHEPLAILLIVLVIIHLLLNFNWIKCMIKNIFK